MKKRLKSKEAAKADSTLHTAVTPLVSHVSLGTYSEASLPPNTVQAHTHRDTDTQNEIHEILERCEARLRKNGFLSKVKFGDPNTEGAVDHNGERTYNIKYNYWLDYKKSFNINK